VWPSRDPGGEARVVLTTNAVGAESKLAAREWHGARESSTGRWLAPAMNSFPTPPHVPSSCAPPCVMGHGREEGEGGGRQRSGDEGVAAHG
jgi:hypothetical protein